MALWKSHKNHCSQLMVWSSQSIWMGVMGWRNWNNLSIVPRIATCWWSIGRSGRSVNEGWCCEKAVVGGIPTMQVEEWLASELVPVVGGHLVLGVVLLDVVEMLSAG